MYVYADIVIAINLVMNTVILVLTAWGAGISFKVWRVLAAAAAGGVYSLGELSGGNDLLYGVPAKLAVSVLLVAVAFGIKSVRLLALWTGYFYLISFLFGGAVLGWLFLAPGDAVLYPGQGWPKVAWTDLAAGGGLAFVLVFIVGRRLMAGMVRRRALLTLTIRYGGRQTGVVALVDTGNSLYTMGHKPVILVEHRMIIPVLSQAAGEYLAKTAPDLWLVDLCRCADPDWLARIEIIPYRGVGNQSVLLGFRPDSVLLAGDHEGSRTGNCVIGIYGGKLSSDGSYTALLHPAAVDNTDHKEGAVICA
ncbi:MAG TPA: sigma-E processing peptidase SpoIIGA [Selenomonadales bacterium]|nr:sigma-E processing peptidase SpoIIGA [Selenomonadales bacterium]